MKETIIVPTELSEITLGQMQYFHRKNEGIDDDERNALALMTFCGVKHSLISKAPQKSLKRALFILSRTLNQNPIFQNQFTMNGIEYGFIPNLDEMSFGEFVDLQKYQGSFDETHNLMAILFRPITSRQDSRYSIKAYNGQEDGEAMKEMPVDVALGAKVFFWNLGRDLTSYILNSLTEQEIQMHSNNRSAKNGDGSVPLSDYVKTILEGLKMSQPYPYIRF